MSGLAPIVLHQQIESSWLLMPEFLRRVKAFAMDEVWTERAVDRFKQAFARGKSEMLGIALVGEDRMMHGHLLAGIETMLGEPFAVVYQLGKDKSFDSEGIETTQRCQDLVDGWALTLGVTKCTVSVLDERRERLFLRHGYEKGPRLLHRDLRRQQENVINIPVVRR
jgi:hypothetical protein